MYTIINKTSGWIVIMVLLVALSACGGAKLSVADEQMARGEFYDASRTYRKVYDKLKRPDERPLRGQVAMKMAECYRRLGMDSRASAAYQNAIRFGVTDSMAVLRLAESLHAEGKYAQAITNYQKFLESDPTSAIAETGLAGATLAKNLKSNPTRYKVQRHKLLNSSRSDYAPMYAGTDFDMLYYTTTNEKVKGDHRSEITGAKKPDIWVMKKMKTDNGRSRNRWKES